MTFPVCAIATFFMSSKSHLVQVSFSSAIINIGEPDQLLEGKKLLKIELGMVGLQKFTKRDSFQGNACQSGFSNFMFHGNYEVARIFLFPFS